MSNPMYGSNKADNFQNKQVMVVDSPALSSAGTVYAVAPWKCKVLEVRWVMNVALTTAKSTLTLKSSAGTMGGTHEIAASSAIGASGVVTPTSNNIIEEGETIEIENDAAPDAGQATFVIVVEAA
tara:strand:- start:916 stop:1290 length:375 start_codon:yes stop_codon:yes gene_type:complete